jgi:hypothetical protein
MDRTAQKKAITDLINPTFNALDLSDQAASKSGSSGSALSLAQQTYNQALVALNARTPGSGTAWDAASASLIALQAEQPVDFQAAIDARAKFNGLWQQMVAAVQALLQNPGEVENVSGKV